MHIDFWRLKNEFNSHYYNMIIITLSLIIAAAIFTIFLSFNPLTLGILILFIALTLAMLFATSMSSWVAFLVFLIYIGGMLVIFSYFVALIPNQTIYMWYNLSIIVITFFTFSIASSVLKIHPPIIRHLSNQLNVIYIKINTPLLILLAWILLFTIIVVVKVVTQTKGPLRPFSYV